MNLTKYNKNELNLNLGFSKTTSWVGNHATDSILGRCVWMERKVHSSFIQRNRYVIDINGNVED